MDTKITKDVVDLTIQEMHKNIAEWIKDPVAKAKSNLDNAKKRWKEAARDEIENGPNVHINGDMQFCTYGDYAYRMEKEYKEAADTYEEYLRTYGKKRSDK